MVDVGNVVGSDFNGTITTDGDPGIVTYGTDVGMSVTGTTTGVFHVAGNVTVDGNE